MTNRERAHRFLSTWLMTERPPKAAVVWLTTQFEEVARAADTAARVDFADKLQGIIESEANGTNAKASG